MAPNPGRYELRNNDPLAQNNLLRETINRLPKRHTFGTDTAAEDGLTDFHAYQSRLEKRDRDEYRATLRDQFAARLAESYATPSLQKYALMLFENVYNSGLKNDALAPFTKQKRQSTSKREECALMLLAATDDLDSPGLYDLQTAKRVETILYGFARDGIDLSERIIRDIHGLNSDFSVDENNGLGGEFATLQQLQEITTNWPQEYRMQYGEDMQQS